MDRRATEGAYLIDFGGRCIDYRFVRRRRRTIGITIDANGLSVAAPLRAPRREVHHHRQRLLVTAPSTQRVAKVLIGWLKTQALDSLTPRAAHYAAHLDVAPPLVGLSNARTQWGVCTEA